MLARNEVLARVAINYQKVWNWKYNRYYFVNLREDKKTSWNYPPSINKHNEDVIMTPRSYFNMNQTNGVSDLEYIHSPVREQREARARAQR